MLVKNDGVRFAGEGYRFPGFDVGERKHYLIVYDKSAIALARLIVLAIIL